MIRKTLRFGGVRTSVKLEPEFWAYLGMAARSRGLSLSALADEVVAASPAAANRASALRVWALAHAVRDQRLEEPPGPPQPPPTSSPAHAAQ